MYFVSLLSNAVCVSIHSVSLNFSIAAHKHIYKYRRLQSRMIAQHNEALYQHDEKHYHLAGCYLQLSSSTRACKMRIWPGMRKSNIGPRALLASPWSRVLMEMPPADWISTSRGAYCSGGISLRYVRWQEGIRRHVPDLQRTIGIQLTPSWDGTYRKKLIKRWYVVKSSRNNDDSMILFRCHTGIFPSCNAPGDCHDQ